MGYTLNEQTEELTLCVKRGRDTTIAEYIMKPGEMAFDKTNCILKINNGNTDAKFSDIEMVNRNALSAKLDSEGNTINTTYLKLSGGTMTNEIVASGSYNKGSWNQPTTGALTQIVDDSYAQHSVIVGRTAGGTRVYGIDLYDSSTSPIMRLYSGSNYLGISSSGADYNGNAIPTIEDNGNGYWTIKTPTGSVPTYIRAGTSGFLPYKNGGDGYVGTPDWPFNYGYFNNIYGTLNGNVNGTASGNAVLASPNNLMHSGNEFTYVPDAYSGSVWHNYRTANWNANGNISAYYFGNGKGSTAGVTLYADKLEGTAAVASKLYGAYTGSGGMQGPSYIGANSVKVNMMNGFNGLHYFDGYADVLMMNAYNWSDVPYATALAIQKNGGTPRAWIASGGNNSTWGGSTELITASNIGSQSVDYATYSNSSNVSGSTNNWNGYGGGSGYMNFPNGKICWGIITTNSYAANSYGYADVNVSGGTFASAFSSAPKIFFQSLAYEGIIDIQPHNVTGSGIWSVRIHRRGSSDTVDGASVYYLAIG